MNLFAARHDQSLSEADHEDHRICAICGVARAAASACLIFDKNPKAKVQTEPTKKLRLSCIYKPNHRVPGPVPQTQKKQA